MLGTSYVKRVSWLKGLLEVIGSEGLYIREGYIHKYVSLSCGATSFMGHQDHL